MIHLLVSSKHIQCIKWENDNGRPVLLSASYVPYKSKKISDNPSSRELANEINTVLQLQKKKFSFEGEQVHVTIPDSFCSTAVIYPDEEMSEADSWELSKWTISQRFIKDDDSSDEFFGKSFSEKIKNVFSLKVSSTLTETLKISIQELGGNPIWMGTESSVFYGLNPSRGITLLINDRSGYEYYHYSKNSFTHGDAKFTKNKWRLSSYDGSVNENDIFKGQIIIPGKISYRRKSHFEGKRIRQVEPFKNIKKNDIKIPKELTLFSQAVSTALIHGDVVGHSLNFFTSPGLHAPKKEIIDDKKDLGEKNKKRKKPSKRKKSSFQQFFAYLFFFGALTAVIFREDLPAIYDRLESEIQLLLNPPSPVISSNETKSNPTLNTNLFDEVSFLRSQSLVNSSFILSSAIDSSQINSFDAGNGKLDILLTGSKNSIFPVDTIGSILNYSLRQVEGKDLYEFGYLVQYDPYFNETLKFVDQVSLKEFLDYLNTLNDIDIKKLDSFSRNALEHTPIIVSTRKFSSFKNILNYMVFNGSNLVLEKVAVNNSDASKPQIKRLFITFLNYSDN